MELRQRLIQNQKELIGLLDAKTDDFLQTQTPGHTYDFQFLIEGIVQHDIYHQGQIGVVAKQARIIQKKV